MYVWHFFISLHIFITFMISQFVCRAFFILFVAADDDMKLKIFLARLFGNSSNCPVLFIRFNNPLSSTICLSQAVLSMALLRCQMEDRKKKRDSSRSVG